MKKLSHKLFCLFSIPTVISFSTMGIVSCNNGHGVATASDIIYESQNYDYVFNKSNQIVFTFKYTGKRNIEKIDTVSIENTTGEFNVLPDHEAWKIDDNQQFHVTVVLEKDVIESHIAHLSFIFSYTDDELIEYYEVLHSDNIKINCEKQEIVPVDQYVTVDTTGESEIDYQYHFNSHIVPDMIRGVTLQQESTQQSLICTSSSIPVDQETHNFTFKVKLRNEPREQSLDITFSPLFKYKIQSQSIYTQAEPNHFVMSKNTLTCVRAPHDSSLFTTRSIPLYLNYHCDLGIPTQIKSLRAEIVDKSPSVHGSVAIKQDKDIHVSSQGDFFVELQYLADDSDELLFGISVQFYASFYIGNMFFNSVPLDDAKYFYVVNEPNYDGTKVCVFALDAGSLSIPCLNYRGEPQTYTRNVWYSINGKQAQQYDWDINKLDYEQFDQIELWCNDGEWSTADYYFILNFSRPVTIQGDVTALLDGQGGQIKDLYDRDNKWYYVFQHLFCPVGLDENAVNVVSVSPNFLAPESANNMCYYEMFKENKNLLYGPEMNFQSSHNAGITLSDCFSNCTKLIEGPTILPESINELGQQVDCKYDYMFLFCENLIVAPIICPKENFTVKSMFTNCKSLQKIVLENYKGEFKEKEFNDWVFQVPEYGELFYKGHYSPYESEVKIPAGWDWIKEW